MLLKNSNQSTNSVHWFLIGIFVSLFIDYITLAASEKQSQLFSRNQKYTDDFQPRTYQENSYSNRNQQGQRYVYNNNRQQPPYQGSGRRQYPQRDGYVRGLRNRTQHNYLLDIKYGKCRIWIPLDVINKYPWATKIQPDAAKMSAQIETCCPNYGAIRWRGNTYCRPLCANCVNGVCVSPNECECHDGFVKNDNNDCIFTCPLGCLNGRCYLDGTCQCDAGYKLDETRTFCRPICSAGCGQSEIHNCTEPEVCGCSKGYQLTDNGCQPTCDPDCGVGGTCVGPNFCECNPGFQLKDRVCQEECYQKCENGICYSRNRCICNPGFTYHERSTQCVPV